MLQAGIFVIYFTPIINLDFDKILTSIKISKLDVKRITDEESSLYFGISERVFDDRGLLARFTQKGNKECPLDLSVLNELEKIEHLYGCKYAFVSELSLEEEHTKEVEKIIDALRLLKINGITCPITFNDKTPGRSSIYPLLSRFKGKTVLSSAEITETENLLKDILPKINTEDTGLLRLVAEYGESIRSLVFLVIILERTIMKGDANKNEISFKIRVFGAKSLAKYFEFDEKEVFETLRKAYELRSNFMHGDSVSLDDVGKIFSKLYDYTVKILQINAKDLKVFKEGRNNLLFNKG